MTNPVTRTLIAALFIALPALAALPAHAQDADLVETAQAADDFEVLVTALTEADLVAPLKGEGPFTVFAPTDSAFSALGEDTINDLLKPENKEKLQSILTFHVVEGRAMAEDVVTMESVESLGGPKIGISVEDGTVTLRGENRATVTTTDIEASNGVIHVIDTVLMPPSQTATMDKN